MPFPRAYQHNITYVKSRSYFEYQSTTQTNYNIDTKNFKCRVWKEQLPRRETTILTPASGSRGISNAGVLTHTGHDNGAADYPTKRLDGIDKDLISVGHRPNLKANDFDDLINSLNQFASMDSSNSSGLSPSSVDEYETDVIADITTPPEETNVGEIDSHPIDEAIASASVQNNSSPEEINAVSSNVEKSSSIDLDDNVNLKPPLITLSGGDKNTSIPDKIDQFDSLPELESNTSDRHSTEPRQSDGQLSCHNMEPTDDTELEMEASDEAPIVSLSHDHTSSPDPSQEDSDQSPGNASVDSMENDGNNSQITQQRTDDNDMSMNHSTSDLTDSNTMDERTVDTKESDKQLFDRTTKALTDELEVYKEAPVVLVSPEHASSPESSQDENPDLCSGNDSLKSSENDYIMRQDTKEDVSGQNDTGLAKVPTADAETDDPELNTEVHSLTNVQDVTGVTVNDGSTISEDQNDKGMKDKMIRFRDNLQCLKSKAVSLFGDKNHQDTPVVSDLPLIKQLDPDDNDVNPYAVADNEIEAMDSPRSKVTIEIEDGDEKTRQDISDILQEINCLSTGDDSVFETTGSTTDSNSGHSDTRSKTPSPTQKTKVEEANSSSESGASEGLQTQTMNSLPSINGETTNNNNKETCAGTNKNQTSAEDDQESVKLIPDKDLKHGYSLSSSSGEMTQKDNQSQSQVINGSKERPKSGMGSVISRLFENLPFVKQSDEFGKTPRPSSEHLTLPHSHSVKFYSMADDHGRDRGLFLSPEERGLAELVLFMGGLPQFEQGAEGGETNDAFEGELETDLDDLVQLLLDLSEQLKNAKSLSEFETSDEVDKSVREIRSDLLDNVRLLQKKLNIKTDLDMDSIDDEEDYFPRIDVSEGAMRLAGLGDGLNFDPEQPMISSKRSSNEDNLSLEFFVPGSSKTFRLHRRTFFAFMLKYSIFMFSFLFWVTSLSVMGFGGWMLATEPAIVIDEFTDVLLDPYALLCIVGGTIFLVAFFGCIGALRENICLLKIFHLAMTFVLVLEILVGAIVFLFFTLPEFRQAAKVGPEEVLKRAVVNYFDDQGMQRWIDNLQKQFRCCGTSLTDDGYLDWQENIYFNCSSPSMYRCSVPLSCCIFEKGDFIDYMCGADIIRREDSYVRRYINTKGCMKSLGEWLADNTTIIAYITAGIVIPQILSVVSARYFISMLQRYTREEKRHVENSEPEDVVVQSSNHTDPDEGERGFVEGSGTNTNNQDTNGDNAKKNWRRLSNSSKAIFQTNLGSKTFSGRTDVYAGYTQAYKHDSL